METEKKPLQHWKDVTPEYFEFNEKGQVLIGRLAGYTEFIIKTVPVKKWTIKRDPDGSLISFLGGVQLDPLLLSVPSNTMVKLEYMGKVKVSSGNQAKVFKLFVGGSSAV